MSLDDDVNDALAMDEPTIAARLLDAAITAMKRKSTSAPRVERERDLAALLRQRALLAEEESIDDDLPTLAEVVKHTRAASLLSDATHDDHARHAWALLMKGAAGKAESAADDDALVLAALAWRKKPSPDRRAAMIGIAGAHLERVVRLLVQRGEPALDLARALYAARVKMDGLAARGTLRALRLLVATANAEKAPDAAALAALDPRHGAQSQTLAARLARLTRVEQRFGREELVLQPLVALASAARDAEDHEVAREAGERLDAIFAPKRTAVARDDRRYYLGWLRDAYLALGRFEDALGVVEREEAVLRVQALPAPNHLSRAEIAEARGDWDGCFEQYRAAIASYVSREGEGSSNAALARGWLAQARSRRERQSLASS
jgi:hypothetical protein